MLRNIIAARFAESLADRCASSATEGDFSSSGSNGAEKSETAESPSRFFSCRKTARYCSIASFAGPVSTDASAV